MYAQRLCHSCLLNFDLFCHSILSYFSFLYTNLNRRGSVKVTDEHGDIVWEKEGGYGAYHSVILEVKSDGTVQSKDNQDIYVSPGVIVTESTGRQFTKAAKDNDPLWPGIYPTTLRTIVVNVKTDIFPEESSWEVWMLEPGKDFSDGDDWEQILYVDGAFANQVTSEELRVGGGNLYMFVIKDGAGDGICCKYRNGWYVIFSLGGACCVGLSCLSLSLQPIHITV
jgi:hypothetical protein